MVVCWVLLAAAVAGCRGGSGTRAAACQPLPAVPALPGPGPAAPRPDAAGLRVVEQGFAMTAAGGSRVSIGATLRNDGPAVAYRVGVHFAVRGAGGRPVVDAAASRHLDVEVPFLRPGERLPVGASAEVVRDARGYRRAERVDVVVDGAPRYLPDGPGRLVQPVPVAVGQADEAGLTFTAAYPYCAAMVYRGTSYLLRNAIGAIVGGGVDRRPAPQLCRPGRGEGSVVVPGGYPTGTEPARTQLAVLCDVAPPAGQPSPTAVALTAQSCAARAGSPTRPCGRRGARPT
jgi:hypothetical protein